MATHLVHLLGLTPSAIYHKQHIGPLRSPHCFRELLLTMRMLVTFYGTPHVLQWQQ